MPRQPTEIASELVAELDQLSCELEQGEWQDPESDPRLIRAGRLSAELAVSDPDDATLDRVRAAYSRTYDAAAVIRERAKAGLRQTAAYRQHARAVGAAYASPRGRTINRSE